MVTVMGLFQTQQDFERAMELLERYSQDRANVTPVEDAGGPDADTRPIGSAWAGQSGAAALSVGVLAGAAWGTGVGNFGPATGGTLGAFPLVVTGSLADTLAVRGVPPDEADFYQRSVAGGASLVVVETDDAHAEWVRDIFRRANAVMPNRNR